MLVFISDLHFVDETAGKHNLPAAAFEKFLTSIKIHADKAKAKRLKIVFLGDIFDLLRTEEWFKGPESSRPWGKDTVKMEQRANGILEKIAKKNKRSLDLFKPAALAARFANLPVEIVYIPGNHDRLCWTIAGLQKKVIDFLSLDPGNQQNFQPHFMDTEHCVYALHGHCFDKSNYEGGPDRTLEDYRLMPIGDPIATELVARLPFVLMKKAKQFGGLDPQQLDSLKRNFQEIENVRPFSAALAWLLYQLGAQRPLKAVIEDAVHKVASDFEKLTFVKEWYERHDRWYKPFDSADQIQGCLYVLKTFRMSPAEMLMGIVDKIRGMASGDAYAENAGKMFGVLDSRIQYIVMGHTHEPLQQAMGRSRVGGKLREHVYLNTGTWRKRYHECHDRSGFIGWQNMTYVILYTPEEKPNAHDLPVFETWTGALKREQ